MYMFGPLFYLIMAQWLLHVWAENGNGQQLPRPLELKFSAERSLKTNLMDVILQISAREGLDAMLKQYAKTEANMRKKEKFLSVNHPGAILSKFSSPEVTNERSEMAAFATLSAAKAFRKHYKESHDFARQAHPQKISLRRTALEALCPPRDSPNCVPASERYRTHDGTCNNKRRPRWGAAQMPFNRFLPPEFGDGVDTIRNAVDGTPLSSARFVSLLVHGSKKGDASITLMTAQWGQLLDHDMTATAQPRPINGSVPSCCGSNDFHPSCFPIKVPLDDPWLAPLKVRCLEFLRSAPAQRRNCVLSWREQTNQATAFIDASPIYSNSARLSDNTRSFRNGSLTFGRGNPHEDVCQRGALATHCIRTGDGRSGEQPGLLALHQVWVGEHNRIAQELVTMNAHWSDEKIYQESRRIVGAMFQHITYREFLPIVLGREVCKLFDLELLKTGFYQGYDPKVNPTIANAFSAAAFRFGHSLIQDSYMRCDRQHNVISNNVSLHEEFQRGDIGSVGSLHRLLRGLATQRALKRDEFITPELTNHLFQTPGFPFGLDLAAINIQRGRDHGIAPYTAWRVPCGLTPIHNWEDLATIVGPESAKRIGHAYRSVHDIDLFVGGISERPVVGGLVGPTFACIIAQQFSNTRKGDRFWYENGGMESSFTPAQLQSIRQVLFSQVLCRAVGEGTFQTHIFIPADIKGNERLPCGQGPLAPIDLEPWREQGLAIETQTSKQNFETIEADEKMDIMAPIRQTTKGNKIGFQNRMPIVEKMSPSNQISMKPTSGVPLFKNMTKINDKLDIKRKQTHIKRPKPVLGINNKIDKGNKITSNVHRTQNQRPKRRRVIINNVPMELRTAPETEKQFSIIGLEDSTLTSDKDVKTFKKDRTINERSMIESHGKDMHEMTPISLLTKSTDDFPSQFSNISDLNPIKHASTKENKRVQRKLDNSEDALTLQKNLTNRRNKGLAAKIENSTKFITIGILPESKRYTVSDYTTPRNLAHADEYEIEINIRQTKRDSVIRSTPQYSDYETSYLPFNTYDRYSPQHEQSYTGTSAHYAPDYVSSSPMPNRRTRPPTIIYLNEAEDKRTTRKPTKIQNFMSYTRPQSNNQKTSSQYESIVSSGGLSITQPTFSNSISPSYSSNPQSQFNSQLPNAASTYSQVGSQHGGGAHVSSSAVSAGNFGSISGIATANDGDTSFSFNIRPKPAGGFQNIVNSGKPSAGYYEMPKPNIFSEYGNSSPLSKPQDNPYEDNSNEWSNQSPFSTASKRPHNDYYSRRPYDKIEQKDHKISDIGDLYFSKIHRLDTTIDYDYEGKTLQTTENNDTTLIKEEDENDFEDYNEDIYEHNENLTKTTVTIKEDDEIFKPETMALLLLQKKNKKPLNVPHLDDTYVMALLNITENTLKPMTKDLNVDFNFEPTIDFINTFAKNTKTEILAEEDFEHFEKDAPLYRTKVAFAPIRVLTNPERPDNWVIFDVSKEQAPLPELPDVWTESVSTIEVPSPLRNMTEIWLSKLLNDNDIFTPTIQNENENQTTDLTTTQTIKMTDLQGLQDKTTTPTSISKSTEQNFSYMTFKPDDKIFPDAPET